MTENCIRRMKELHGNYPLLKPSLRLSIKAGSCYGFQYIFTLDRLIKTSDRSFERDGVTLLVAYSSLHLVNGATIDYVDESLYSAFQVSENPNVLDHPKIKFYNSPSTTFLFHNKMIHLSPYPIFNIETIRWRKDAIKVFEEMIHTRPFPYDSLFLMLLNAVRGMLEHQLVVDMVEEMIRTKCPVNVHILNNALDGICMLRKPEVGLSMLGRFYTETRSNCQLLCSSAATA